MRRVIFATIGLLIFALPQAAVAAPKFTANWRYAAKFVCGEGGGSESREGVVEGHYNTVINVLAIKNRAQIAYRATALSTNLDVNSDVPTPFSQLYERDMDGGFRIVCADIKRELFDIGQEGFIEGFVAIYSTRPLNVVSVVTGQGDFDEGDVLSVMQLLDANERTISETVEYLVENED
jgi:hypothetical protein